MISIFSNVTLTLANTFEKLKLEILKSLIIIFSSAAILTGSLAKTSNFAVEFGGWSHHFHALDKRMSQHFSYNESHSLIGFRYTHHKEHSEFKYSFGANYMKDSFNQDAYALAVGVSTSIYRKGNFYADASLIAGAQYRGWLYSTSDKGVYISKVTVPFIAPELKVGYKSAYLSTLLIPNAEIINNRLRLAEPTLFFQFGINLF